MSEDGKSVSFEHNTDGSVIIKLAKPVKVNGEEMSRATIPAIRGKHMRLCPFIAGDPDVPVGKIVEFAAMIIVPAGFVDELDSLDSITVGAEVSRMVGKGQPTGSAA